MRDGWQRRQSRQFLERNLAVVEPTYDHVDRAAPACTQPDLEHRTGRSSPTTEQCDVSLGNLALGLVEPRRGLGGLPNLWDGEPGHA